MKICNIEDKLRPIAIKLKNDSSEELRFVTGSDHFETGKWFETPNPRLSAHGGETVMFAANRDGAPTGTAGEFKFKGKTKIVHVAFKEPLLTPHGAMTTVEDINSSKPDLIDQFKDRAFPKGVDFADFSMSPQADDFVTT